MDNVRCSIVLPTGDDINLRDEAKNGIYFFWLKGHTLRKTNIPMERPTIFRQTRYFYGHVH